MTDSGSTGINRNENRVYTPGMYQKERPSLQGMVENIFDDWKQKRHLSGAETKKQFPVICFSRRIGVGALEIADILASQIGYRVIDREIMEYLANRNGADPMFAEFVDGHHIPEMEDILAILFGVKTYAKSEYSRLLFRAIFSFAALGPAIFVGRGAHFILPRERILAVRLICSDQFRIARVADMLKISESDAVSRLKQLDDDQERFFQNIYGVNEGTSDEYDIIINRDFFQDPAGVAEIVKIAFIQKFGVSC